MATLVMITKLGLHRPLQTLSHDTHVKITHSPALQPAIQTWRSPFKDKLPLFTPNNLKKRPGPKVSIKMYPKTGSAQKQARPRSWTGEPGPQGHPHGPHISSWDHEPLPQPRHSRASTPQPAQPQALLSQTHIPACPWLSTGRAQGWDGSSAPGCGWDRPWLPFPAPWNKCGTRCWVICSEAHTAAPDHCINQHWRADLPPNTISAVILAEACPAERTQGTSPASTGKPDTGRLPLLLTIGQSQVVCPSGLSTGISPV